MKAKGAMEAVVKVASRSTDENECPGKRQRLLPKRLP